MLTDGQTDDEQKVITIAHPEHSSGELKTLTQVTWSTIFCDIVDKHLPLRKHHVKRKQQPKWLTEDIIDAFKIRDRFKSVNNEEQYKVWRNKVNKMIKISKKRQYSEIINENSNNPASVWKLFKELGASKRNIGKSILSLKLMAKSLKIPLKFHLNSTNSLYL